jgi:2-keto-4-pentenoate hydratase
MDKGGAFPQAGAIARRLVEARLAAASLAEYPGDIPQDLETGYAIQDAAIALWPDEIIGWKLGRVGAEFEARFGNGRLAGPIFRRELQKATGVMQFPVFRGGFAAVEGEFVIRVGRSAPSDKLTWSTDEAWEMVAAIHIGIETAGSPMRMINDLGPAVVVSDFGNNAGLILGGEVRDWRNRALETLRVETFIDGISVGTGTAAGIPGGPIESLRFLLENTARRGCPVQAGMLVTTGAVTGIHVIECGQSSRIVYGGDGEIHCHAIAATPQKDAQFLRAPRV